MGIIGVVSALTIPTLISKYQDKEMDTRYKKVKSVAANGYKMMLVQEQVDDVSQLPFMYDDGDSLQSSHRKVFKIMKDSTNGSGGMNLSNDYKLPDSDDTLPFSWDDVPYIFQTSDGMTYGVDVSDGSSYVTLYVDVNGKSAPNKASKDAHKFLVSSNVLVSDVSSDWGCSVHHPELCKSSEACLAGTRVVLNHENDPAHVASDLNGCYWVDWWHYDNKCVVRNVMHDDINFDRYCR